MLVMGAGLGIVATGLWCYVTGQERLGLSGLKSVSLSAQVLILAMVLVPSGLLFAISSVTPIKVFVPRYFILCNTGLGLLVGWGIAAIRPESVRSVVSGAIIACSLGAFGSVGHAWPLHHNEDWRDAMAKVRQVSDGVPVIFQSPFVESGTMLRHANDAPDFLRAPLAMYPVPGHVIPVPRPFNANSIAYLSSDVVPAVEKSDRFVLVTDGPEGDSNPYIVWVLGRFPEYSARNLGDFGESLRVTLFTRRERVE
jgi:hypothetical protein